MKKTAILSLVVLLKMSSASAATVAPQETLLGTTLTFTKDVLVKAGQTEITPSGPSSLCILKVQKKSEDYVLKKDSYFFVSTVDTQSNVHWDSDGERRYPNYDSELNLSLENTDLKISCEKIADTLDGLHIDQEEVKKSLAPIAALSN